MPNLSKLPNPITQQRLDFRIPDQYWTKGGHRIIEDTSPEGYCKEAGAKGWCVELCAHHSTKGNQLVKTYYILAQAIRHNSDATLSRSMKHRISKLVTEDKLPELHQQLLAMTEYDGGQHRRFMQAEQRKQSLQDAQAKIRKQNLAAIKAANSTNSIKS